jgi:hypothetical protein
LPLPVLVPVLPQLLQAHPLPPPPLRPPRGHLVPVLPAVGLRTSLAHRWVASFRFRARLPLAPRLAIPCSRRML